MRLGITAHQGGCVLLLVALVCLGFAACGDADSSGAGNGASPFPTVSSSTPFPTATRAVVGPVAVTATPSASARATGSAATATLTCAVHSAEGSEDDETQHTLICTVKHAPLTDTHFTLRYGVRDPAGSIHPLDPACAGSLRNGAGSCKQTYEFIFPFPPVPAPVTGESLPSATTLGPATPSSS